jgi:uncharacterized protein YdeI (YjbR/CyaY-like superfamily)
MLFASREDFRAWLEDHCLSGEGVWLIFGKPGGPDTLTAHEALEEALCFGWIDGQIRSIDGKTYRKYFTQRREKAEWSEKNIALTDAIDASGKMTDFGRAKIEKAKRDGYFKPKQRLEMTEEHVRQFIQKVEGFEPAYANLQAMPPSVQRVYTAYSLDTKSDEAGKKRLEKIIDRLNRNLKPM